MIVFLTLVYVAVLAVLVKLKIVQLNTFWKLSPCPTWSSSRHVIGG